VLCEQLAIDVLKATDGLGATRLLRISREEAKIEIFEYIELFYNWQRLHQSLGYQTPAEYDSMKRVA